MGFPSRGGRGVFGEAPGRFAFPGQPGLAGGQAVGVELEDGAGEHGLGRVPARELRLPLGDLGLVEDVALRVLRVSLPGEGARL